MYRRIIFLLIVLLSFSAVTACKPDPPPFPGNGGSHSDGGGSSQEPSIPGGETGESGGETGESGGSENEERPPAPENPDLYYIILDPNGGTGERLYEERGKNTVYYSAYTSFTKDGCAFLGWAESKTAETILYADGSPIPVTGNRLLYAVWVPESEAYTVTFDLKGGVDNGMPEKLSCRPGGSIRLPSLDNTYKAGYVRDGYSPDGTAASGVLKAETEFFSDRRYDSLCGVGRRTFSAVCRRRKVGAGSYGGAARLENMVERIRRENRILALSRRLVRYLSGREIFVLGGCCFRYAAVVV